MLYQVAFVAAGRRALQDRADCLPSGGEKDVTLGNVPVAGVSNVGESDPFVDRMPIDPWFEKQLTRPQSNVPEPSPKPRGFPVRMRELEMPGMDYGDLVSP
jgi:hypothetical protein